MCIRDRSKAAGRYAEGAKVAVRGVRRDGMEQIKAAEKKTLISQDETKVWSDEVQKLTDGYIKRIIQFARQGYKDIEFPIYDTDWDSEAYLTVSGQNSNNTVRVTDEFLKAVEADGDWDLTWRTKPGKLAKTVKACLLYTSI